MKIFYLTGSVIFTVLILLMAFGNIDAQCGQLYFLFFPVASSPTILILGIAVIGMIAGALYHGFIQHVMKSSEDGEDENF